MALNHILQKKENWKINVQASIPRTKKRKLNSKKKNIDKYKNNQQTRK